MNTAGDKLQPKSEIRFSYDCYIIYFLSFYTVRLFKILSAPVEVCWPGCRMLRSVSHMTEV